MSNTIVNVASVRQLSPFRYPGGKTWLVPEIKRWLANLSYRPSTFIEPFAGGGIASLTAVFEDYADHAIICEIDDRIAAVWKIMLQDAEWLIRRILRFELTHENVMQVLSNEPASLHELAFQTLVRNRVQRGGIIAPGASLVKKGENGRGIGSRWYPETLADRIAVIHSLRKRITFIHGDGFDIIRDTMDQPDSVYFIDPPYTAGGKNAGRRLYSYNDVNHIELFDIMSHVQGKFMMTYSDSQDVIHLTESSGFRYRRVLMKNTHHETMYELIIEQPAEVMNTVSV